MSKYKFRVSTYAYDSTGYYIGQSDEVIVTVTAENSSEAKTKALKVREGDQLKSTHDTWGATVLSADEIDEPLTLTKKAGEE